MIDASTLLLDQLLANSNDSSSYKGRKQKKRNPRKDFSNFCNLI